MLACFASWVIAALCSLYARRTIFFGVHASGAQVLVHGWQRCQSWAFVRVHCRHRRPVTQLERQHELVGRRINFLTLNPRGMHGCQPVFARLWITPFRCRRTQSTCVIKSYLLVHRVPVRVKIVVACLMQRAEIDEGSRSLP